MFQYLAGGINSGLDHRTAFAPNVSPPASCLLVALRIPACESLTETGKCEAQRRPQLGAVRSRSHDRGHSPAGTKPLARHSAYAKFKAQITGLLPGFFRLVKAQSPSDRQHPRP